MSISSPEIRLWESWQQLCAGVRTMQRQPRFIELVWRRMEAGRRKAVEFCAVGSVGNADQLN